MHRVAVLAAALCVPFACRAVAQNATREEALAEAVHVEPKDDPCLSEAVVRARVGKRLARGAELSNVEVVVHAGDPPRLTVLREGAIVAERRFEDFPERCNARRDAIAVAVALALERAPESSPESSASASSATAPTASATATPATAAAPSPAAPSPAPVATAPAARAPENAEQEAGEEDSTLTTASSKLGAHAGATALLAISPGLALAGVLGADVELPAEVRWSLSVVASLPQEHDALGATVKAQLLMGRLLGCTDLSASELALEGCGGALAGAVFAEGLGYASTRSTELGYAALLARVALRYPAQGMISARLALDGLLPLLRPSYAVREQPGPGLAELTPAPVGAGLGLEVVLALP